MLGEISDDISDKTIRSFSFNGDLWPIVDRWSQETGFRMIKEVNNENNLKKLYKKKDRWHYFLSSGDFSMLQIIKKDNNVNFAAWVRLSITHEPVGIDWWYMAVFRPASLYLRNNIKLESGAETGVWFNVPQKKSA